MRLWRAPFSTNVERVALALAHKGLAVESVWISCGLRGPSVPQVRAVARSGERPRV